MVLYGRLYSNLFPCIAFSVLEYLHGWEKRRALILKCFGLVCGASVLKRANLRQRISIIYCPRCSYIVYSSIVHIFCTYALLFCNYTRGRIQFTCHRGLFTNISKWCLTENTVLKIKWVSSFYYCNFAPGLCLRFAHRLMHSGVSALFFTVLSIFVKGFSCLFLKLVSQLAIANSEKPGLTVYTVSCEADFKWVDDDRNEVDSVNLLFY